MSRLLVTPPAFEPVSLADFKAHAKVETDADDLLIGTYITAARVHVEASAQTLLINQTWRFFRDAWPTDGALDLPIRPVQMIQSITLYDVDGTPAVLNPDTYKADLVSDPIRIQPVRAEARAISQCQNGLEIDVLAGFGPTSLDVPAPLRLAILQLAAFWYENRSTLTGAPLSLPIPDLIEPLLAPFRPVTLGLWRASGRR